MNSTIALGEITRDKAEALRAKFIAEPKVFFSHFLGCQPWERQLEIVEAVRDNRVTSVRSCHASGKSWIAARIALWYLICYPNSKVITTAPTARQMEGVLWREINDAYTRSNIPFGGECLKTKLDIKAQWFAVGLSTTDPDKFQGYHAERLLVIPDESAGIPEAIWEGVRAITTSTNNRVLMIGNPTSLTGRFYNSHREPTVRQMKISAFDTPNFLANGLTNTDELREAIESGREIKEVSPYLISPIAAYEMLQEYGPEHPAYVSRVLAEFPSQEENTLIPLNLIESAMEPERATKLGKGAVPTYGVDVARFGSDKTVIAHRWGNVVDSIDVYTKQDTMQTVGRVRQHILNTPGAEAYIDVIGVGAGVYDRLNELRNEGNEWQRVFAVNVAERAEDPEKFFNKRAEIYWRLRKLFEAGEIAVPHDKFLLNELATIQYRFVGGKIRIEEKDEIKKRTGRSPDRADALMLAFAQANVNTFIMSEPNPEQPDPHRAPLAEPENQPIAAGLRDKQF